MSVPTRPAVDDTTANAFAALALGQTDMLEQAEGLREQLRQGSGLDPRSFSLVKIAALVAVDAPPASYLANVGSAMEAGVTIEQVQDVLVGKGDIGIGFSGLGRAELQKVIDQVGDC